MSLLTLASNASAWRGYEYYRQNKVEVFSKADEFRYSGVVSGSGNNHYAVYIDTEHPRSSSCNCPHADGRRIICKHMIALYFTAFPDETEPYERAIQLAREEEEHEEEIENAVIDFVSKMKKHELQHALLELLFDGPDWQFDKFVREHIDIDDDDDCEEWDYL